MDDVGDGDRLDGSVDGWDRACEVRERRCVAESHRFVAATATVLGSEAVHRGLCPEYRLLIRSFVRMKASPGGDFA